MTVAKKTGKKVKEVKKTAKKSTKKPVKKNNTRKKAKKSVFSVLIKFIFIALLLGGISYSVFFIK